MILNDFAAPREKFSNEKLDAVLSDLCGMVLDKQDENPDFYGMVAAAVLDPQGRLATGINYLYGNGRVHAERAAIDRYEEEYGELPKGCIVITTLSPCSQDTHDNRQGESCADLLASKKIKLAYCGYQDPTQEHGNSNFLTLITDKEDLKELCKTFADTFLKPEWDDEEDLEVEDWQFEDLRQHLLTTPHLFENDDRYVNLKNFLDTQNNVTPKLGNVYGILTIKAIPLGQYISIAKTLDTKLLLKITPDDYVFDFGNQKRLIPRVRFNEGDSLSYTLLFDDINHLNKVVTMLKLKYSNWRTPTKDLLETYRKKTNEVIHHTGIKTKNQDTSGLVNRGEPVPPGKEAKLLGTKVGKLGNLEVYKWDKGGDSAYSVYDPTTRVSQLTVSGHNKPHSFVIFGVYGGPKCPIKAADLYAWLVKNLGLTLVSDKYQSPGGHRVWQDLEQRYGRTVNVYAYNMRTNEPINTGADDPESTHGTKGDVAQNVRLVAAPK